MSAAVLTLFCALAVSEGCSTNRIASPTSKTASMQDLSREVWQLTFQLTGGLAGMDRQLELANTGELKVTDHRRGTQAIARASASELAQIASLVAELKSVEVARGVCRDCIQYDFRISSSGRTLHFTTNDAGLAGTPLEPLANVLTGVLNRELSR